MQGKLKHMWWKVGLLAILLGAIIAAPIIFPKETKLLSLLMRLNAIAITIMFMAILNDLIIFTYGYFKGKTIYKKAPLKGIEQITRIIMFFIGGIIIVAILLDKSPAKLLMQRDLQRVDHDHADMVVGFVK